MSKLENINEAFARAQVNFTVPIKDKKAHYGKYASIGSINAATQKALSNEGLSVMQPIITFDHVTYIQTELLHSSGESKVSMMPLPSIEKGGNYFHKLGSAISYTRRYALMAMLNVSADDVEDDGDSLKDVKIEDPIINDHQYKELKELFDTLDKTRQYRAKDVLTNMNVTDCRSLPAKNFQGFYNILLSLKDDQANEFFEEVQDV